MNYIAPDPYHDTPPDNFLSEGAASLNDEDRAALRLSIESDLLLWTAYWVRQRVGTRYDLNSHHVWLADALMDVAEGKHQNLLINMPPGGGKTELSVTGFISYYLALNSRARFMHLTSSPDLANNNSEYIRDIFNHEDFRAMYPTVSMSKDTTAKQRWNLMEDGKRAGGLLAMGIGQNPVGFRAGRLDPDAPEQFEGAIVIDDPQKPDEMNSQIYRENTKTRMSRVVLSRRATDTTPIIVIMQRLHLDDISNWLLEGRLGVEFDHIQLPAIIDDGTKHAKSYWPAKQRLTDLKAQRKADPFMFEAQYMQKPIPVGGGMLKRKWWSRFPAGSPKHVPEIDYIVMSWDLAASEKEVAGNSYTACTVWAVEKTFTDDQAPRVFLMDAWRGQVDYVEVRKQARSMWDQWYNPHRPDVFLIEDKSNGRPLKQEFRRAGLPVMAVMPTKDKVQRAYICQAYLASGMIYAPETNWANEVVDECAVFPNGVTDDYVDTCTQAWRFIRNRRHDLTATDDEKPEAPSRVNSGPLYG